MAHRGVPWTIDTEAIRFSKQNNFVWVTKCRYQVLKGEVAERVGDWARQTREAFEIRINRGVVSKDPCAYFGGSIAEFGIGRDNETNQGANGKLPV